MDHKTHFISGANSYMFRHQYAIIREFFSNKGTYRGADKSLAQLGRKQARATEDFDVHISYFLS